LLVAGLLERFTEIARKFSQHNFFIRSSFVEEIGTGYAQFKNYLGFALLYPDITL